MRPLFLARAYKSLEPLWIGPAVASMLFISNTSFALTFGDYTYTVASNQVTITAYNNTTNKTLIIPSTISNIPVVNIGDGAFMQKGLTNVTIPTGITYIGTNAFAYCTYLQTINIPSSVLLIEKHAFRQTAVTSMLLPNSIQTIRESTFNGCTNLNTINIPDSVKTIEYYAFSGCNSLKTLTLGKGTEIVESYAFSCPNLTNIIISKVWTNTPSGRISLAFSGCPNLSAVSISEGNTSIPDSFFYSSVVQNVSLPASTKSLGNYCFYNCLNMTSISVPAAVTNIGYLCFSGSGLANIPPLNGLTSLPKGTFMNCQRLTDVIIPDNIKQIEADVFAGCASIQNISVSGSVTNIMANSFPANTATTKIYFLGSNPPTFSTGVFASNMQTFCRPGFAGWPSSINGQTISLVTPQPPEISLNQPYQGYASISFKAIGGINYAIQRSFDLTTWQNARSISGAFNNTTLNDPLDFTNKIFYRVIQY